MSEMVEIVARALEAKINGKEFVSFEDAARAAIEAMRIHDDSAIEKAVSAHLAWKPNRNTPRTACQDFGMQQREILRYQTVAALDAYFAALPSKTADSEAGK
jgi:hypothetical protein